MHVGVMKNDKHPVVASPPRGSIRALRVPFKIGRTGPRVVFNPRVPWCLKFSRSNLNLAIIDVKIGIFPRHRFFTRFAYCRPVSVGIAWISPSNGVGQVTKFFVYQREPRAACLLFGCSRVLRLNVAPYHLGTIFRDIKGAVSPPLDVCSVCSGAVSLPLDVCGELTLPVEGGIAFSSFLLQAASAHTHNIAAKTAKTNRTLLLIHRQITSPKFSDAHPKASYPFQGFGKRTLE